MLEPIPLSERVLSLRTPRCPRRAALSASSAAGSVGAPLRATRTRAVGWVLATSNRQRGWLLTACCLLLTAFCSIAWACPMCKEALISSSESVSQPGLARSYLISIGVLIGIPMLLVGLIGGRVVWSIRRTQSLAVQEAKR